MIQPTYTWKIDHMTAANLDLGRPNYVIEVAWTLTGRWENMMNGIGNRIQLDRSNIQDFVAYEYLSEQTVVRWVKQELGAGTILVLKAMIQRMLNDRLQPELTEVFPLDLPWAALPAVINY